MKRGLSTGIIGLLVCLVGPAAMHTTSAQGCQATVTVEGGHGEVSSTARTVPISMTRSQAVRGLQMEIRAEGLTARECRVLDDDFDCWLSTIGGAGTTRLILTSLSGRSLATTPEGIAEVDYDVDSTAQVGKVTLQLQNVLVADAASQACSVTTENGSFVVSSVQLADVNGSMRVDGFDLIRLHWAWASTTTDVRYDAELDLNEDGEIGTEDLEILRPYFGRSVN